MTPKEKRQIAEEVEAATKKVELLEFALEVVTEVQKETEKQIIESEANK